MSTDPQAVRRFIASTWDKTRRLPSGQGSDEIRLPKPFLVPMATEGFHLFFYWDTYFACEGLVRDGRLEDARDNADNFLHLIDALGYVPNFGKHDYRALADPATADKVAAGSLLGSTGLTRSQPPVASATVRLVYERSGDKEWLARAHASLQKEYMFWSVFRGRPGELNRYGHQATPTQLAGFYNDISGRVSIPDDPTERLRFLAHYLAEAESGWDFNPRFDGHCLDYYPIDLNCLLFQHEMNAAWFCEELGLAGAEEWRARAETRRQQISELCWDETEGFFFDYDAVNGRRSPVSTPAAYFALWCGVATPAQAAALARGLPKLEEAFGLATTPRPAAGVNVPVYQWAHPNAWPPLQFAAVEGLRRYGFEEDARRLAEKYVRSVADTFTVTGNLWEKYNAVSGGIDVANEYPMPKMLGWTAGVFIYCCEVLGAV